MKLDKFIVLFFGVLLFTIISLAGCATRGKPVTTYPSKPITIVVPFSAGGSTDMVARSLEKVAPKYLGQPLVVTNIPGGTGTIGLNELAGSKPDGYTMGMAAVGVILQPLYGQTRYHYSTALEPLAQVTSAPFIVIVQAEQPWQDMRDLVEYAKQHPGEIKFGHPGLGSGNHVAGEMLNLKTSSAIIQVPFRGDSEMLAALLGGHVQLMLTTPPAVKEYVKSGKLKVLGIASDSRINDPVFSNALTFKEQGIDMSFGLWHGIAVPKGIPAAEKQKLVEGLQGMINDPEFRSSMEALGMPIDYLDNKDFAQKWANENNQLTKAVKETGIAEIIASQKK